MKKSLLASIAASALAITTPCCLRSDEGPRRRWRADVPPTRPSSRMPRPRPSLSTLVAAVKAAGLVDTLSGPGPFTVFAPDNDAFNKLPPGTVDTLVKPENKADLTKILTYHVVAGKMDSKAIAKAIKKGATAPRPSPPFRAGSSWPRWMAASSSSPTRRVEPPPSPRQTFYQSNGVAHVIDTVLMPN